MDRVFDFARLILYCLEEYSFIKCPNHHYKIMIHLFYQFDSLFVFNWYVQCSVSDDWFQSKVEIDPAMQRDAGYYECQAYNKYAVDIKVRKLIFDLFVSYFDIYMKY